MAQVVNPVGNAFGNPQTTEGISPELMQWLRQQAMDQLMAQQANAAIASSSAFQPQNPALGQMIAPVPQQLPPAAPVPQVAPPMPVPMAPAPVAPPMPMAPQSPAVSPQPPVVNPQQPALGTMMQPQGAPQPPVPTMPGAGSPLGAAGAAALPPEIAPGIAKSPEEAQARHEGWVKFVDQVKADPNLLLALTRFGTQILQPMAPGQNPAGHFAGAVQNSIDYVSANKESQAKLAQTQAGTAQTQAQTETEKMRPAAVEAGTAKTAEETTQLKLMSDMDRRTAETKIRKLVADAGLAEAHAKDYLADSELKRNPDYVKALINELEARAWAHRNRDKAAETAAAERAKWRQQLIESSKLLDPEITRLWNSTTPGDKAKAEAMATERANTLMFAGTIQHGTGLEDAESTYANMVRDYKAAVKAGDSEAKKLGEDAWIGQRIMQYGLMGNPKTVDALNVIRNRRQGGGAKKDPLEMR